MHLWSYFVFFYKCFIQPQFINLLNLKIIFEMIKEGLCGKEVDMGDFAYLKKDQINKEDLGSGNSSRYLGLSQQLYIII